MNRAAEAQSIKALTSGDRFADYGSEGWGFEFPSGAQKIKAVTRGNVAHGLLCVPQASLIFP
jgi:hypothetical protein